jgi:hypothetical protein
MSPVRSIPAQPFPFLPIPFQFSPVQSIPFLSIPFQSSPIQSYPFHSIQFHASPVHSIPSNSNRFHALPFQSNQVHSVPFDSIPVHSIPVQSSSIHSIPFTVGATINTGMLPQRFACRTFIVIGRASYNNRLGCNVVRPRLSGEHASTQNNHASLEFAYASPTTSDPLPTSTS